MEKQALRIKSDLKIVVYKVISKNSTLNHLYRSERTLSVRGNEAEASKKRVFRDALQYISVFFHLVDIAAFKIVIDYIVRNFDPTGINIGGLIDSFYFVLIKPKLSFLVKIFKRCADRCLELAADLRKSLLERKFVFYRSFMLRQGCFK